MLQGVVDELKDKAKLCRIFSFVALLIAATAVFYWQVLLPQLQKLAETEKRCLALEARNVQVADFAGSKPDAGRFLAELERQSTLVKNLLPDELNAAAFLLKLDELADVSKVELLTVRPGAVGSKNGYCEMLLEVKAKGNYYQLLEFLRLLEGATRFVAIDKGTVQSQGEMLKIEFALHIYSFGTDGQANDAARKFIN